MSSCTNPENQGAFEDPDSSDGMIISTSAALLLLKWKWKYERAPNDRCGQSCSIPIMRINVMQVSPQVISCLVLQQADSIPG